MRAVVQRVCWAKVCIGEEICGEIGPGLCILLGIAQEDDEKDILWLSDKIAHLRIFDDAAGKLNLSLCEVEGAALVVSQFTLYGDCRKGRRPSYTRAASPERAKPLYERFIEVLGSLGIPVATGVFQAMMRVELSNDGPVTLILDSRGGTI